MADKQTASAPREKRGGYSGTKPGYQMRPPAKIPSGFAKNGTPKSDRKSPG